jgi:hypothetical protein
MEELTMNLSKYAKISSAITPTVGVAGTLDITGSILDMQGYEGVLMVVRFGTITAGAVTSIKAQQGNLSNLGDAADLEGTGQDIADSDDDETFYIDLVKPTKRYVRLYVDRGTQNAVVAGANYIQYGSRKKPPTHGTGCAGETHVSPEEGTA